MQDSASEQQNGRALEQPAGVAQFVRPLRILVVDDEAFVLSLLQYMLRPFDHEVVGAGTVQEASQRFDAAPSAFDVVITDLILPDGSGWDIARRVRARNARVGVVLLTGWDVPPNSPGYASETVDAVLQKPFRQKELLDALCRALSTASQRLSNGSFL
jgi:two-component system cell cycle response regulator CpdR